MQAQEALNIGETLNSAWKDFTNNAVTLVVGILLVGIIGAFTLGICLGPMIVGYCRVCLKAARGGKPEIGEVFSGFDTFGPSFLLFLLAAILITIGFVLLFIPGLALTWLFFWAFWYMAEGDRDAVSCLKRIQVGRSPPANGPSIGSMRRLASLRRLFVPHRGDSSLVGAIGGAELKRSTNYQKDAMGPTLVFWLVNTVVSAVGAAVAFGSLVTGPIAMSMAAHGFLRGQAGEDAAAEAGGGAA